MFLNLKSIMCITKQVIFRFYSLFLQQFTDDI